MGINSIYRMAMIHEYKVQRKEYNSMMRGCVCYEGNHAFYFDQSNTIQVGDVVKFEHNESGSNYKKLWINNVLIQSR